MNMNDVKLFGRLTADPEIKKVSVKDGAEEKSVINFTLAVDDSKVKDRTDFVRVEAWGNLAENCEKFLRKGYRALVSGSLRIDSYTDKDGVKRNAARVRADNVQFIDFPPKEQSGAKSAEYVPAAAGAYEPSADVERAESAEDDEIAF